MLGGELGGKFWPPRGLSPKRRCPRSGRFSKPLRELPCCLRGAWDFGWLRPDLSLASEPARQVRWLVRAGRPRARLGGSAPATGTSATGQATDSVGSFASVGPGGAERGSGTCPPATGTSVTGQATDHLNPHRERGRDPPGKTNSRLTLLTCSEEPGHGPPDLPPRTRSGTPWKNRTRDLPCLPVCSQVGFPTATEPGAQPLALWRPSADVRVTDQATPPGRRVTRQGFPALASFLARKISVTKQTSSWFLCARRRALRGFRWERDY